MNFDISTETPATDAQLRALRALRERLDRVSDGHYAGNDIPPMTKSEATKKIGALSLKLAERRQRDADRRKS